MPQSSSEVHVFRSHESLPPTLSSVFSDPGKCLFEAREWLRNFEVTGIAPGSRIRLYAMTSSIDTSSPVLLPAVYSRFYVAHGRSRVVHFFGVEGTPVAPWPTPTPSALAAIRHVIGFIHADRQGYDVLRFSPVEPFTPVFEQVVDALRRSGHPTQVYERVPASFASTSALTFDDYLTARPHAFRASLDAAERALLDAGRASFRLIVDDADIGAAARDFKRIVEQRDDADGSETPRYLPGLMAVAARSGVLRLGFLDVDGAPVAAQVWVISSGIAHCLRIVSVADHDNPMLDDVLTARLARHLIDIDRVVELEYGTVTADFASKWASGSRRRVGVIAFNPRTWRGVKGTVRHIGLPRMLSIPRRLFRKLVRSGA